MLINLTKNSGKSVVGKIWYFLNFNVDRNIHICQILKTKALASSELCGVADVIKAIHKMEKQNNVMDTFESYLSESRGLPLSVVKTFLKETTHLSPKDDRHKTLRVKGPGNSAFIIHISASDVLDLEKFIKNYLMKKCKFKFDDSYVRNSFEKKVVIEARLTKGVESCSRTVFASVIGADEVVFEKKHITFYCTQNNLSKVKQRLKKAGYEIKSIYKGFLPISKLDLKKQDNILCSDFLCGLQSLPQVISIFHNVKNPVCDIKQRIKKSALSSSKIKTDPKILSKL